MDQQLLNITPDPKVLIALTHTPLKPLDALCELMDNGFDSFRAAKLQGNPQPHPLVTIAMPGNEVRRGDGALRIVDNGPGLDRDGLKNAITAGYSGNPNRYDSLGLFGMGFNISTGKLGRRTTVTTARAEDSHALRVTIHLPTVVQSRRFEVPVETVEKPPGFSHGTIVEISEWWGEGDPNGGFIWQLAKIAKEQLREQIARRYATILRSTADDRIRVILNDKAVAAFEHCVWVEERFVDRPGWGVIPARINFDTVVSSQLRCIADGAAVPPGSASCLQCGGTAFRTIDERIRGWVGIQRFDDNDLFGIDLLRNGRAIRVAEKDAFFNYVDDFGHSVREYPTDQQSGRIVGEVHLDHVAVDFQKQDFQRSSEEWLRAMKFLRGGSLLPSKWPENERNETPVSRLFQGFRKVRTFGRHDMYMGVYDPAAQKAVRIGRDVEKELYQKFLNREAGYYDDLKWWEHVVNANTPPVVALEECPNCGYQNAPGEETCGDCGKILIGKNCISCTKEIAKSAASCPFCGKSQIPEVQVPWICKVCHAVNNVEDEQCAVCKNVRGTEAPCDPATLRKNSIKAPELSFQAKTFTLVDGKASEPLDVSVYRAGELRPRWNGTRVPAVTAKNIGHVEIFIDPTHALFTQLGLHQEEVVAFEAGQYLYEVKSELIGKAGHSVGSLAAEILIQMWGARLASGPEAVRQDIREFFLRVREQLLVSTATTDFYGELGGAEQNELAKQLISAGELSRLTELVNSGEYIRFAPPAVIARYFLHSPAEWFGAVFNEKMPNPEVLGQPVADTARTQLIGIYARCLDDCAAFLGYQEPDRLITAKARASHEFLEGRLV